MQLFNSILLTLPRLATSSGGKSPADAVLDLAADIMGKLPVNYNMEAVCKQIHLCQCVTLVVQYCTQIQGTDVCVDRFS